MLKKLRITVDGQSYSVTVEDMTDPGTSFYPSPNMSAVPLEPSAAVPAVMPTAAPAPAAAPSGSAAQPGDVVSPMTGVLIEYTVKEGDLVEPGQQVATIEAMKMKTAVVSQNAGKVTKLHVAPETPVDAGQPLVSIG